MVLSRCEAIFFIAIGWSMLTLAAISFITSCIAISTMGIFGVAFAGFGSLYVCIKSLTIALTYIPA